MSRACSRSCRDRSGSVTDKAVACLVSRSTAAVISCAVAWALIPRTEYQSRARSWLAGFMAGRYSTAMPRTARSAASSAIC